MRGFSANQRTLEKSLQHSSHPLPPSTSVQREAQLRQREEELRASERRLAAQQQVGWVGRGWRLPAGPSLCVQWPLPHVQSINLTSLPVVQELAEAERRVRSGADAVAEGLVAEARAEADAILAAARDECRRAEADLRALREQVAEGEAAVKRREVAAEQAAAEARGAAEAAAAEQRRAAEAAGLAAEKERLLRSRWAGWWGVVERLIMGCRAAAVLPTTSVSGARI